MWEHVKTLWAGSRVFQVALIAGGIALLLILAAHSQNPAGLSAAPPSQARGTFGKVGDGVDTAVDVGSKVIHAGGRILGPLLPGRTEQPAPPGSPAPPAQAGNP